MDTDCENELTIIVNDDPSTFFFKMLQTIPVRPEYLHYANFIAEGLSKVDKDYNKKCLEQRIIPHSYLSLKSYSTNNDFYYTENKLSKDTTNFSQVLKGGKI